MCPSPPSLHTLTRILRVDGPLKTPLDFGSMDQTKTDFRVTGGWVFPLLWLRFWDISKADERAASWNPVNLSIKNIFEVSSLHIKLRCLFSGPYSNGSRRTRGSCRGTHACIDPYRANDFTALTSPDHEHRWKTHSFEGVQSRFCDEAVTECRQCRTCGGSSAISAVLERCNAILIGIGREGVFSCIYSYFRGTYGLHRRQCVFLLVFFFVRSFQRQCDIHGLYTVVCTRFNQSVAAEFAEYLLQSVDVMRFLSELEEKKCFLMNSYFRDTYGLSRR